MAVDEVELTFHATGVHGGAVNDLQADELRILDNGTQVEKILAFRKAEDLPIRAGLLIDTSESMANHIGLDRAIAAKLAQRLNRQQGDQAFAMDFGYGSEVKQDWTTNGNAVTFAIQSASAGHQSSLHGTAIFDALFRACFHQMSRIDRSASGNFLVLFSDGEDNASHTSLPEAVDACQHAHTAVYVFRAAQAGTASTGPGTLAEIARETGGRVFHDDDVDAEIDKDIAAMEAEQRSRYWLVYRPGELKRDGAFHPVTVLGPDRVKSIEVRNGYYAPQP